MPVEYFFVHKIKLDSQEKLFFKIFYKFAMKTRLLLANPIKKIITGKLHRLERCFLDWTNQCKSCLP